MLSTHDQHWGVISFLFVFPVKQRQPTADVDAHIEQESADSIPTCRRIRNYTGDIPVLFVSL